jgi:hypothetical protein
MEYAGNLVTVFSARIADGIEYVLMLSVALCLMLYPEGWLRDTGARPSGCVKLIRWTLKNQNLSPLVNTTQITDILSRIMFILRRLCAKHGVQAAIMCDDVELTDRRARDQTKSAMCVVQSNILCPLMSSRHGFGFENVPVCCRSSGCRTRVLLECREQIDSFT